jgi:hypothetical protein
MIRMNYFIVDEILTPIPFLRPPPIIMKIIDYTANTDVPVTRVGRKRFAGNKTDR